MAANAAEFVLSLKDKLTGGAKSATKGIEQVTKALKDADATSKALERTTAQTAKAQEAASNKAARAAVKAADVIKKNREELASSRAFQSKAYNGAAVVALNASARGAGDIRKAGADPRAAGLYQRRDPSSQVARATGLGTKQMYAFGTSSERAGRIAGMLGDRLGGKTTTALLRGANAAGEFAGRMPSLGSMAATAGSALVGLAGTLLTVGLALGAGGVGLVAAGVRFAAEMAGFKEQTLFAYKYVLGSKEKAGQMFDEADQMARAMGAKTSNIAESMRELMSGGFSASDSKTLTMAMQDVIALNPSANIANLSTQLGHMKGAGRVLMEDLKPMLEAGLNDDIFYKKLREMTGEKDQTKLKKLMESGKVSSDQGIQAIIATIAEMGGNKGLGSVAAARANETMQGQVDSAKAMFERLFMSIQSGPAGAAVGSLAKQMQSFLDPKGASGQRLLAIFGSIAAGIAYVLASLQGGALSSFLGGLLDYFEAVRPIASAFFGAFAAGLGEAITAVRTIMAAMPGASGVTLDMVGIAKALGAAFAWVAVAIAAVVGVLTTILGVVGLVVVGIGTAIVDLVGWAAEFAAKWGGVGFDIATQLITGLVDGVSGGTVKVVAALASMGSAAISAVKDVFDIHSPSRVFHWMGRMMGTGLEEGVDASAPAATNAVTGLVGPSAFSSLATRGSRSGGGNTFSVGEIHLHIEGGTNDAEDLFEKVRRKMPDLLRDAFADMGAELGASPA